MADQEDTTTPEETAPEAAVEETAPEPEEQLSPKEARQRARQRRSSARKPSTPEERAAERKRKAAERRRRRLKEREARRAQPKTDPPPPVERPAGRPKTRQGVVVSAKPDKTITVRIDAARRHRRYEKIVRSSTTLHVHDEANEAHEGDTVRVIESRPMSRLKRWRLVEVVERAR